MKISAKKIEEIYKKYEVPKSIIAHMREVAKFAKKLCERFESKGFKIDCESAISACLLHDVLRYCDFKNFPENSPKIWNQMRVKYFKKGHEKAMSEVLKKMGYHKIANLVKKHDFFRVDGLKTIEEKIVFYSDKRVDHDKVVSLKKRFKEGRKRNFSDRDDMTDIEKAEAKIIKLEKEINYLLKKQP